MHREPIDPETLAEGQMVYTYSTDRPFVVHEVGARYGLSCSVDMVAYRNVNPTDDAAAGQVWYLDATTFIKLFYKQRDA